MGKTKLLAADISEIWL